VTAGINRGFYSVDFGPVSVGQEVAGSLLLVNVGISPLQVLSVRAPPDTEFGLTLESGTSIQPGAELTVPVSFKPVSPGTKSRVITIQTDSQSAPTLTLYFTGAGQ
jgi:hypothetical protein